MQWQKIIHRIKADKQHVDILAARFVLQPERFDVVVASNLFGDILSGFRPCMYRHHWFGGFGKPNPERKFPSLFEPVHGSAPDIYGQQIANPLLQFGRVP
jgi:tartrate dehydrogenase/decarboxylase/D-malate dehydrogenase